MTDARLVWDTWRRILKDDALVDAVVRGENYETSALSDDERAIVADYASDTMAADFTVGMYRNGLVRNTLTSLNLVPLSRQLLYGSELDPNEVAEEFAKSIGYRDDGANFWRAAADFVEFLAKRDEFQRPEHQDVFALDRAAIALVRRLGENPPTVWPEHSGKLRGKRYVANRAAVIVETQYDVTPWLEDDDFDPDEELQPEQQFWLIYVPTADDAHTYAELSDRAAHVFALLATPKSANELPVDEVDEVLESLLEIGAVHRVS